MPQKLLYSLAAGCGDGKYLDALGLEFLSQAVQYRLRLLRIPHCVHLVGRNDLGPVKKARVVGGKLLGDGADVLGRIPALHGGRVNYMYQNLGAFNMAQEGMPQADALAGALDEARNIRHDKSGSVSQVYHAQVGIDGGEMIVRNLRAGIADPGEKG